METNTKTKDITHALDKIAECARNLKAVACTVHTQDYRHNIFQLSYNAGRLSELTGEGRKIYDELKPEIASGLLYGWNTIENVIVPRWRKQFLSELDPDRELYFAEYDSELGKVIIMEKIHGGYWARTESGLYHSLIDADGNCGELANHAGDLRRLPLADGLRVQTIHGKEYPLTPAVIPEPREVQLV